MAHEKVYAICESKCREETMTKQEIRDYGKYEIAGKIQAHATSGAGTIDDIVSHLRQATTLEQVREYTAGALSEISDTLKKLTEGI